MDEITTKPVVGNPHVRVIIVDDESSQIPEVLGISKEREEVLDQLIKDTWPAYKTITDVIANMSKHLKHANELAYCVFHVGAHMGASDAVKKHLEK